MRDNEIVIDFETDYSSTYSVSEMGYYAYTHDERFNAYLIGWADNNGSGACDPLVFDWGRIKGKVVIAHNAVFDWSVYNRLVELGVAPKDSAPAGWLCSSAMARYFQCGGSLEKAAAQICGIKVDKAPRSKAKGQSGDDLFGTMAAYCEKDATVTKALWEAGEAYWPEAERRLWFETAKMGFTGITLDLAFLDNELTKMNLAANAALDKIPWHQRAKPTSTTEFEKWCKFNDQDKPASTAGKDAGFIEWRAKNLGHPVDDVVEGMQEYRSANRSIKVLLAMKERLMKNGRMEAQLMYFGANTGRWSGGGQGLNLQNLTKFDDDEDDAEIDFNPRGCLVPAKGHKFLVIDLAQIEARCTLWIAGDLASLELMRSGMSVYEAHARASMGWEGGDLKKENKALYALSKARILSLGFCVGPEKFKAMAKTYTGKDFSIEQCQRMVKDFRDTNPMITAKWKSLQKAFDESDGGRFELGLHSGRKLLYRNVKICGRDSTAEQTKCVTTRVHQGVLIENASQATARDIFADRTIALIDAGFKPVLYVHDEWVIEIPEAEAEEGLKRAEAIIKEGPTWAKELPIGCEGAIMERYAK